MKRTGSNRSAGSVQATVSEQASRIRDLEEQLAALTKLRDERSELEAELRDLRSENRELTRVNREHAKKYEALKAENAKLRARGGRQAA